jgi:hypothetical protein
VIEILGGPGGGRKATHAPNVNNAPMKIMIRVRILDMVLALRSVTANGFVPGSNPRNPRNNATNGDAMRMSLKDHKTYSSDVSDMRCEKTITAKVIGIMQKVTAAKITIQRIVIMIFCFMHLFEKAIMLYRSPTGEWIEILRPIPFHKNTVSRLKSAVEQKRKTFSTPQHRQAEMVLMRGRAKLLSVRG